MTVTADYPLGNVPWIESPFFQTILAQLDLRVDERDQAIAVHRDGYFAFPIDYPDFDAASARIVADLAEYYGDDRRIQDAWRFQDDVRRLASHEPVLTLLRRLYGREPIPFQTLNFRMGTEQPLHSDMPHFSSIPERFMAGVWIALEDIDSENGPLEYVPGSHRFPAYANEHIGVVGSEGKDRYENTHYKDLWAQLVEANGLSRHTFHAKKGTALLWTANLLHGGAAHHNRARTRHSMVTHYYFENCVYFTPFLSDPALGRIAFRDVRDIRTGEVVPNIYNGRVVPSKVIDTIDTHRGLNAIAPRLSAATPVRGSSLLDAGAVRQENVMRDGFARETDRLLLHPNAVGAAPARTIISGVDLAGRTKASGRVAVLNERSDAVRFRIEIIDRHGRTTAEDLKDVQPGADVPWSIDLESADPHSDVVLSTTMAPGAASNDFAWAFWIAWRLSSDEASGAPT